MANTPAEAADTDYYFGAKESFDAHGRETYTAKDLGISTTDEAVLAAAHRYARDFRRVRQLMDDAILGRERTYTPVDVAALTVKHRDLQHDLADVLRRMESTGNPEEFQAEKVAPSHRSARLSRLRRSSSQRCPKRCPRGRSSARGTKNLLAHHPMLKRRYRIEMALGCVRAPGKLRKKAEKNGQKLSRKAKNNHGRQTARVQYCFIIVCLLPIINKIAQFALFQNI